MYIDKFILLFSYMYFQVTYEINGNFFKNDIKMKNILKKNINLKSIPKTILVNWITKVNTLCYFPILKKGIYDNGSLKSVFNDPDIKQQWYFLKSNSSNYITHNLQSLWERNITGNGIVIGIIGGGIQVDHKDLKQNYLPKLSYNFAIESPYTSQTFYFRTTELTGFIVAASNNSECGVGAAPSSLFSSLQIFDDNDDFFNENKLARALVMEINKIDIYFISFNVLPTSEIYDNIVPLTIYSLEFVLKYGRRGRGNIVLMSSGILHELGYNCAFRELVQRAEVFVIGSILNNGSFTSFSERCTAVLASAISTATAGHNDFLYTTQSGNRCGKSIGGLTSISTSIATGIISLLLSDNPLLSARQVFLTIVFSSTQYDDTAIQNAAGFRYSYSFGFGMLNASEMIRISKTSEILYSTKQNICEIRVFRRIAEIEKNSHREFYIFSDGCIYSEQCVTIIEQMFLKFTLQSYSRNSMTMYITSPSGTKLKIIEPINYDDSKKGFNDWSLKILGFFGESSYGYWMIDIYSKNYSSALKRINMEFYGTCDFKATSQPIYSNSTLQVLINRPQKTTTDLK